MKFHAMGLSCLLAAISTPFYSFAESRVELFSGTFEGEYPAPILVGKVSRGEVLDLKILRALALVNYPNPKQPLISQRINTKEVGAEVSCNWFVDTKSYPAGSRFDIKHVVKVQGRVICDDGSCLDKAGKPLAKGDLLFGKYNLQKWVAQDGQDVGFRDRYSDSWTDPNDCRMYCNPGPGGRADCAKVCKEHFRALEIVCPVFSVESLFAEECFFDEILTIDGFREQELSDLDVDLRAIYLTFINERGDRATCPVSDLLVSDRTLKVSSQRDCVLPPGDEFTLLAQSRFFNKETRACGKRTAPGQAVGGTYKPNWNLSEYECDGKTSSRTPIEKQFKFATRIGIEFNGSNLGGK